MKFLNDLTKSEKTNSQIDTERAFIQKVGHEVRVNEIVQGDKAIFFIIINNI